MGALTQNAGVCCFMLMAGFVGLLVYSAVVLNKRRGILPGMFIGLGLSILVPIGILGVMCATMR
jgi:hypothetical protein